MSSTLESKVFADVQPAESKKLRKAFSLLKTHAAAVANFTLQWQDLEDHFLSIHNSILQAENTLLSPTLQSQPKSHETLTLNSKETQLIPTPQSQAEFQETQIDSQETQLISAHQSQAESQETKINSEDTQLIPTLQSQTESQETQIDSQETQLIPTLQSKATSQDTQFNSVETQLIPTLESQAKSQETQLNSEETQLIPTIQSREKSQGTQIDFKETQLIPTLQSRDTQFNSTETQLTPTFQSQEKCKETQSTSKETQLVSTVQVQLKTEESLPENRSFLYKGKALLFYANDPLKEQESLRNEIYNVLKFSADAGKLVLEALKWFYSLEKKKGDIDPEVAGVRRSSVLLLEELMRVGPVIKAEVREEALKLALEWKPKMKVGENNSLRICGFFLLLSAFGITSEFHSDDILNLFDSVLQRNNAPELFRALGFADKASDFIEKLISQNKRLEAIRFIYAYELVDNFPPVPLLKTHLKLAKKFARMSCKGKNSIKEQDVATNKEIAAIKAVIRCVDNFKLGSQLSPQNLRNRIKQLTEKKNEREATATASEPKAKVCRKSANKRTAPDSKAQLNQQNRNKRSRRDTAFSIHSVQAVQPSYHKLDGWFAGQNAELLNPSAGTSLAAAAMPNISVGATHPIHSRQPTHHQPESLFTGQHSRYLTLSGGQYGLARSSPDPQLASLPAGPYGLLHSSTVTQNRSLTGPFLSSSPPRIGQYMNLSTGRYGMVDSIPGTAHMSSSAGQYGSSIAANESSGRIGSAGTLTARVFAPNSSPDRSIPHYPGHPLRTHNYYDRSVSYSSGYDALPPPTYRH